MHSRGNFENSQYEEPHPILAKYPFGFYHNNNIGVIMASLVLTLLTIHDIRSRVVLCLSFISQICFDKDVSFAYF